MSDKKMKFLFNTLDIFGMINPMVSLAKLLKSRGHEIVFASTKWFRESIESCGFIYEAKPQINDELSSPQAFAEYILNNGITKANSSYECLKIMIDGNIFGDVFNQEHNMITKWIEKHNPDIIIAYNLLLSADLIKSGIPWVGINCETPLNIYNNDLLPPYMSGFATNSDPNDWTEFKKLKKINDDLIRNEFNKNFKQNGLPEINTSFPTSPHLNIICFPKELEYSDKAILPEKWFRIDTFFYKQSDKEFELPEQLANKTGKLIYVSMGTINAVDVDFMKRIVKALSKSPHRFIVSKGQRSSEYELYDNMWGDIYLPQTLILPKVDLVITHGGNNTMAETFYFGKPMIFLPMVLDQFDIAQRIQEIGFGIRLNAQQFTENELLDAIETLLNDNELSVNLKKVSERIQSDNSLGKAVELIENLHK